MSSTDKYTEFIALLHEKINDAQYGITMDKLYHNVNFNYCITCEKIIETDCDHIMNIPYTNDGNINIMIIMAIKDLYRFYRKYRKFNNINDVVNNCLITQFTPIVTLSNLAQLARVNNPNNNDDIGEVNDYICLYLKSSKNRYMSQINKIMQLGGWSFDQLNIYIIEELCRYIDTYTWEECAMR